jgi:hypothetical protein
VIGKTKFEKLNFNVTEFYLEVSADTEKSFPKATFRIVVSPLLMVDG